MGALNFLSIDDLEVVSEGEPIDPKSVIRLPVNEQGPQFPAFGETPDDPFLRTIEASGKKWVIVTNEQDEPLLILDTDRFLRHTLFHHSVSDPARFCHKPIVVRSENTPLGSVLSRLRFSTPSQSSKVIDQDVILLWGETKRVITGSDIFSRLLDGIAGEALSAKKPAGVSTN